MTIDWKKYVDKIYCIQYIFNKQRTEDLNTELFRVDILQSGIYEVIEQFPSPLYDILYEHFNDISNVEDQKRYFNSFIGHYSAVKKAYLDNLDYVLVLEDDCRFFKDKQKINYVLENTINEFKHIKESAIYGGSISLNNHIDCDTKYNTLYNIYNIEETYLAGAAFNIYNRKAMKILIDFVENLNYCIIDQYNIIYTNTNTKIFLINKHLCIQQDWCFIMFNTWNDYNIMCPTNKYILNAYNNCFKIYWNDNRNLFLHLKNTLEHFNIINEYKEIYEDCLKHC